MQAREQWLLCTRSYACNTFRQRELVGERSFALIAELDERAHEALER
jgi:hypothetical protein